jgi:excisionase family DNA binding protein
MYRKAQGVSGTLPTVTVRSIQTPLERLKRALEIHRQALEGLETALLEFEEALTGEASERPESARGLDLLSIPEVCQELGMGKSWVYKHIRSGEIPSIKLGHNIKVRRAVLEEYLKSQAYRPQKKAEEDEPLEGDDHPLP